MEGIWEIVAQNSGEFAGFAPYAPSIDSAGAVAFQAVLKDGAESVLVAERISRPRQVASWTHVISHPDINDSGDLCVYGGREPGSRGVYRIRPSGVQTLAKVGRSFQDIGPLGPTMSETGAVAFRATLPIGAQGIFLASKDEVMKIADTREEFAAFHGLPVATDRGEVVFRADRPDGSSGVFVGGVAGRRTIVTTGHEFVSLGLFPCLNRAGVVAFAAVCAAGGGGVFLSHGAEVKRAPLPKGFESFRGALIDDSGEVIFFATPAGGTLGAYDALGKRLIGLGDTLFDGFVEEFALNPVSISGNGHLAARVKLRDERQMILRRMRAT